MLKLLPARQIRSMTAFLPGMLLVIFCATLYNCGCTDDCASTPNVYLEVVDTAGKNLFAEPDPVLLIDSVKVTGVYTDFIENVPNFLTQIQGKAVIVFSPAGEPRAYKKGDPKTYIISYSYTESDTVILENLVYSRGNECCGGGLRNFDVQLNHAPFCNACSYQIISIIR